MVRGEAAFDLSGQTLSVAGQLLPLTRSEYAICQYLALHAGQIFTKEQIYEAVFGVDGTSDDTAVTQHIKNIRNKLRAAGVSEPEKLLKTVWGSGVPMEKRKLTSLRRVLLQYLLQTALACIVAAAVWFLLLLLLIQGGWVLPADQAARPARKRPRRFCPT